MTSDKKLLECAVKIKTYCVNRENCVECCFSSKEEGKMPDCLLSHCPNEWLVKRKEQPVLLTYDDMVRLTDAIKEKKELKDLYDRLKKIYNN